MRSKTFSIFIFSGSIIALIAWLIVIVFTNPNASGTLVFVLFYGSLAVTVTGFLFLIGNFFRHRFFKKQLLLNRFRTSLRQSIFFAVLITGWLLLQSKALASWWIIILFILILTTLEFFFVSNKNNAVPYEE